MMKKNLLFLFLFLGTFLTLNAQTTVTNSVLPAPGDLLMTRQATSIGGISVTAPGTNLMWDYSAMVGGDLDSVTVVAASTGAFSSMFPTADVILATSILPGENYMDVSTNKVEIVGFAGDVLGLGVVIPAVFDDPLTLLETPLNYQSTFNDTATVIINVKVTDYPILVSYLNDSLGLAGTGIVVDSLRINYAAGGHYEADAWGNLTVPEAGAFDVIRLKQTIISNVGAQFKGTFANIPFDWTDPSGIPSFPAVPFLGISTNINYLFYADGEKEPIAVIEMSQDNPGQISEVTYKSAPTSSIFGFASKGLDLPTVHAYPNPVVESLNLKMNNFATGNYEVKVYNIVGRELMSERHFINNDTTINLNVSDLRKGTYLYSIVDARGNTLVTKRVMIVRP
jgi:hypothetical protein